jgi:hypothetical protein
MKPPRINYEKSLISYLSYLSKQQHKLGHGTFQLAHLFAQLAS